jgi:hypothetical protein
MVAVSESRRGFNVGFKLIAEEVSEICTCGLVKITLKRQV